jgi:hypothetical protein
MKPEYPYEEINDLADNFNNGNIADVYERIKKMPRWKATLVAIEVCDILRGVPDKDLHLDFKHGLLTRM